MENFKRSPLIVVGMHRSGTSLITKLLHNLGLFMGYERSSNEESIFFQERNKKVLSALSGSWCYPEVVNLLEDKKIFNLYRDLLFKDCSSARKSFTYFGLANYLKYKYINNIDIPWGWKDPRNTLLLPLWVDIFPEAKVLHIYRNGIDVSASLAAREAKDLSKKRGKPRDYITKTMHDPAAIVLKAYRKYTEMRQPLSLYTKYEFSQVADYDFGFRLWEKYLEIVNRDVEKLSCPIFSLCYEDFLENPVEGLIEILHFAGVNYSRDRVCQVASMVRKIRAYSFRSEKKGIENYKKYKDSNWFRYYDYEKKYNKFILNI